MSDLVMIVFICVLHWKDQLSGRVVRAPALRMAGQDLILGQVKSTLTKVVPDKVKQGKAALLSLYNELYNETVRLEWRVSPEPLQWWCFPALHSVSQAGLRETYHNIHDILASCPGGVPVHRAAYKRRRQAPVYRPSWLSQANFLLI